MSKQGNGEAKQGNKGGKLPLSKRSAVEQANIDREELDMSVLKVDSALLAKLDSEGLVCRWINASKYKNGGNFHKSGWRPYKVNESAKEKGSYDFSYGSSPEGYLIRNDLILAVKSKDESERWRSHLKKKAQNMSGKNDDASASFKEKAKSGGAKVLEGYEENDRGYKEAE